MTGRTNWATWEIWAIGEARRWAVSPVGGWEMGDLLAPAVGDWEITDTSPSWEIAGGRSGPALATSTASNE